MSEAKKPKLSENENEKDNLNTLTQSDKLIAIQNEMCVRLETLNFGGPIEYVYNPLNYAKNLHEAFIKKYFEISKKKILFLGMNPGPWGMCQTGIVFGEKNFVQNWFEITGSVEKPEKEHPKKKVMGLNCKRSEESGKKFWKFFQRLCGSPENFFRHSYIYNLCPMAFMDKSGKNITPPEIKDIKTRNKLNDYCVEAFIKIVQEFNFEKVIAIGRFAENIALKSLKSNGIVNVEVIYIPHPSPRNAKNSSNWEDATLTILNERNLLKYFADDQDETTSQYFSAKKDEKNGNE